ncbi:hypothetical protein PSNVIR_04272 [Pseudomonas sp. Nvir]|nr:hypothetical protein PSNVIR_04272 [Pseudomonas sp. Nvir]
MTTGVVTEAPGQVVHPHLFAQAVRRVIGKAVGRAVLVDQCGQAQGLVILVADPLALGILATAGQAARGALQVGCLAFSIGVLQHLAKSIVGKGFRSAVRMIDTKHFTIGLAFQRSGLVQRIGNGNQVLAFVVAVVGAFARTVLEALDLRVGIPPQILGLEVGIDDRVRQAVIAVEIPGLVTQRVNLGNQVAFFVVTRLPDAAVGEAGFGDEWRGAVVLVADLATQRVGFLDQPGEFVVLQGEAIAIRQLDADQIAGGVEVHAIAFTAEVTAADDAIILVVTDFQFTAQHIGRPAGPLGEVVSEVIMLAVAGPVLDDARFAVVSLPAVFADQAQSVTVPRHEFFSVAELAYRIAVAIDHFGKLAIVVVTVTHQRFNGAITDHALHIGQAAQWVVVVQVDTHRPWCGDIRQAAIGTVGEMQIMPERIFQALQRRARIIIWHLAKIEKYVIERLQKIVPALGAHEMNTLMGVIDALAWLQVNERNTATLVVGQIDEPAATTQALFPGQNPALPQGTFHGEVTGIETRPFNRHQAWQHEVRFIGQKLAAVGHVDRVACEATDSPLHRRADDEAPCEVARCNGQACLQRTGAGCLEARLQAQAVNRNDVSAHGCDDHQNVHRNAQPFGHFFVNRQVACSATTYEHIVRPAGNLRPAGERVTLARSSYTIDEHIGRAFRYQHGRRMLVTLGDTLLGMGSVAFVDEYIGRATVELDLPRWRFE